MTAGTHVGDPPALPDKHRPGDRWAAFICIGARFGAGGKLTQYWQALESNPEGKLSAWGKSQVGHAQPGSMYWILVDEDNAAYVRHNRYIDREDSERVTAWRAAERAAELDDQRERQRKKAESEDPLRALVQDLRQFAWRNRSHIARHALADAVQAELLRPPTDAEKKAWADGA